MCSMKSYCNCEQDRAEFRLETIDIVSRDREGVSSFVGRVTVRERRLQ